METTSPQAWLSEEEYLAAEPRAEVRHEYLGGTLYAMAGASQEHGVIVSNLVALLRPHLRKGSCRVFATDIKVRVQAQGGAVFYYPDVMVVCDPRDTEPLFVRFPKLIIEVLSPETERTDRREKFLSYTQIETLEDYVLLAQDRIEATVHRRSQNWAAEIFTSPDAALRLDSIGLVVDVRALYEDVKL